MSKDTQQQRPGFWTGLLAGMVSAVALAALAVLTLVYTGSYNVAATEEHLSMTRWALDTTTHAAIRQRAGSAKPFEPVTPEMLAKAANEYKAMCQHCHGGPGAKRAKWADGMRPQPPYLAEAASEWTSGEVLWIIQHGLKMTGMPAFGPSHDEPTLRSIAAFVSELPAMMPERYAAIDLGVRSAHGPGPHAQDEQPGGADGGEGRPHNARQPAPVERAQE